MSNNHRWPLTALSLILAMIITSGCVKVRENLHANATTSRAVPASEVEVFRSVDDVPCDYESVGDLETKGTPVGADDINKHIRNAREAAGKWGADGVILHGYDDSGNYFLGEQGEKLQAVAIRFTEENCESRGG